MSDKCPKCGADLAKRMKYTFVCGTTELTVGGYDDGKECLRRRLAAANAKLSEMARLAEETRLNVDSITGVGGWRPIETAPKDGTNILLREGSDVSQGGWLTGMAQGTEDEHYAGWWSVNCFDNPTHWMPLPQPPKEADDE